MSTIIEIIKIILPIATIITALIKPLKKILDNLSINTEVTAMLLRGRLMEKYTDYMARGYISTKELDDFTKACEKYWSMGLNHFSRGLLDDLRHIHERKNKALDN